MRTLAILVLVSACSGAPRSITPLLYVTNERSGTITVIDTKTDRVVDTIHVGARPRGITLTRPRRFAARNQLFHRYRGGS